MLGHLLSRVSHGLILRQGEGSGEARLACLSSLLGNLNPYRFSQVGDDGRDRADWSSTSYSFNLPTHTLKCNFCAVEKFLSADITASNDLEYKKYFLSSVVSKMFVASKFVVGIAY